MFSTQDMRSARPVLAGVGDKGLRSRRLALSESISLLISFRILGRNSFAHSSFKRSTVKLMLCVKS